MPRDTNKFEYLTYEFRNGHYVVHGWDKYPRHSVLSGQARKTFIDSFETAKEAEQAYPQAEPSHPYLQPTNSFNHLPDSGDW